MSSPDELFRVGLAAWWAADSDLVAIDSAPVLANDDGSPASGSKELPRVVIRLSDAVLSQTTNEATLWQMEVTFEVLAKSMSAAATAAAPLDTVLDDMLAGTGYPTLSSGYVHEMRMTRSRCIQITTQLARASRRCRVRLVIPR